MVCTISIILFTFIYVITHIYGHEKVILYEVVLKIFLIVRTYITLFNNPVNTHFFVYLPFIKILNMKKSCLETYHFLKRGLNTGISKSINSKLLIDYTIFKQKNKSNRSRIHYVKSTNLQLRM